MRVRTATMRCDSDDKLDVTVKGGDPIGKLFAPTWKMVMDYKKDGDEQKYTEAYYEMMRKSYKDNYSIWCELLSRESVTFVCYCRAGAFCHRVILAKIFEQLGADYEGEI